MKTNAKRKLLTRRIYNDAKAAIRHAQWQANVNLNRVNALEVKCQRLQAQLDRLVSCTVTSNGWEDHVTASIRVDRKTFELAMPDVQDFILREVPKKLIEHLRTQ